MRVVYRNLSIIMRESKDHLGGENYYRENSLNGNDDDVLLIA